MRLITMLAELDQLDLCKFVILDEARLENSHHVNQVVTISLLLEDPSELRVQSLRQDTVGKQGQLADFGGNLYAIIHESNDIVARVLVDQVVVKDISELRRELIRGQFGVPTSVADGIDRINCFGVSGGAHLGHSGLAR